MRAGPDLLRPFHRLAGIVQRRPRRHLHRGAQRLEAELFLPPPQHADALVGQLQRDHRGVHRHVVGAVVAVAARAMRVPHDNSFRRQPEHVGQRRAQRIWPLRVRPHRQHAAAIFRQRTGRPHRRVRDIRPRIRRLHHGLRRVGHRGVAVHTLVGGLADQPGGLLLLGRDLPHLVPARVRRRRGGARAAPPSRPPRRTQRNCPPAPRGTRHPPRAAPAPRRTPPAPRRDWAGAGCARAACPGAPCRG